MEQDKEQTAVTAAASSTDEEAVSPTTQKQGATRISWRAYLAADVDPAQCTGPLAAFCFMTGFIDAISFTAIFVWCGFQTGNFVQLALALARLFEGPKATRDHSFHIADQQALTSLITFNAGAFIGRWGDHMGPHTRIWLFLGTIIQCLFTMAASLTIWKSGEFSIAAERGTPSWTNTLSFICLAFMSASLGLQGIQAKRLNTQFTTTIVLTTVWVELMSDPKLFNLKQKVITRDHKLIAASALFIGGFAGRALLGKIGASGALGVGTGLRLLIAFAWLFMPAKLQKAS
ncbi:hypothetical protein C8J56DRAFT_589764 [Mycena floridula]|nr:hypothetical protein C8J56DRAFT_589764 [Mycena floridula]